MRATATLSAVTSGLLLLHACGDPTVPRLAGPPLVLVGQWSTVRPAPLVQIHLHLLPNGKVLSWGRTGDPQVWDPATGAFTPVPAPSLLFCAGHDFLPDGRLLVAGGHISDLHGLANTNVFDPVAGVWQVEPAMAAGRWYPTNTTLPNGEVLTLAGTDETGANVTIPEVWDGTGWRQLAGASLALRRFGGRNYGSAVMYEPGKILYAGGGDPPTNTAEIIDLNSASPTWTYTSSMAHARRQMNATLLPTGAVLVTGGTSDSGFSNPRGAVYDAELWSPETGRWTTLARNAVIRIYHQTSLLLPDGQVLNTGSGGAPSIGAVDELNYELYSPPYLFNGPRPTITGATPATVTYGQTLVVATPDGAVITKVTLIRLGSVTHAIDMSQRLVPLDFSQVAEGLSITLPTSRATAPPGPYMLFLVNGNGVPSVGRIMLLH